MNTLEKELFDYMVAYAIYPFCSKNRKLFLRCSKAEELTKNLLNRFGSLRAIDSASISELTKIQMKNQEMRQEEDTHFVSGGNHRCG